MCIYIYISLERERSYIYWFTPQMAATVKLVQEPGTPAGLAEAQVLEPSTVALQGSWAGSWIGSQDAQLPTGTLIKDADVASSDFTHCATTQALVEYF